MTSGGVLFLLAVLSLAFLLPATLVVVARGGRGPADPPGSHLRIDPAGFPVLSTPRGLLDGAASRRRTSFRSSAPIALRLRSPRQAGAR